MKFLSKLSPVLLISSIFFLISILLPSPSFAIDGPWYNQSPEQFATTVKNGDSDEIFGERYTFAQINWIINSLNAMLNPSSGLDNESLEQLFDKLNLLFSSPHSENINKPNSNSLAELGLPGLLAGGISEIYASPPASGVTSIQDTLASFKLVPTVHAQSPGYGFSSLSAIQKLWSASRNMAYLIMTVLLIASGFLIMFRVKINPQTVVTLQTMIPKLIITMILVTFSFAIAGLVIDLVYVLIIFMISVFRFNDVFSNSTSSVISWFTNPNYFNVVLYFVEGPILTVITTFTVGAILALLVTPLVLLIPGLGSILTSVFAGAGTLLAIVSLLLVLTLVYLLFKIWWMLVKSYITLLLLIIIGPWQIMLDLIPGQQGFGPWIRNVIANASVFFVVPLMLMLNMVFWNPTQGKLFNPLGTTSTASGSLPSLPLFGGKNSAFFNIAVAFAILSLTPKVADMVRDALKVPAFKYGAAFGEALQPSPGIIGGALVGKYKGGNTWYSGIMTSIGENVSHLKT